MTALPAGMIGRTVEWRRLEEFASSPGAEPALAVAWGRRRVGKSYLLQALADQTGGIYYEAVRGSRGEALRELGTLIGQRTGSPGPLAFEDWNTALDALFEVGGDGPTLVILDEYPYLREHTPELDSLFQRAFGPRGRKRSGKGIRLVLCGSAITIMRGLLSGSAPLRGRASLDLRISPFDFRTARALHDIHDLRTAVRTYAVIGGVAAYAREMVDGDLPRGAEDFDRWLCRRVLTPAAPLFNEIPFLLSEDPATAKARKLNLYHATLAGIASGHRAHSKLTRYVKIRGASLAPIVDALVSAELVERIQDPIRENRPTYHPADPLIRFHYALIRRHSGVLSRYDADVEDIWARIRPTFQSHVLGPCFEAMARDWTLRHADVETLGGVVDAVGPTELILDDGTQCELDVVAVGGTTVIAIGEAKVGEQLETRHLRRLEAARRSLGDKAEDARLLLFGPRIAGDLASAARGRSDVVLVDLERLYEGR